MERLKIKSIPALSIQNPWATLIVNGHKTIETRTWPTRFRGDFLICVSKKIQIPVMKQCVEEGLINEGVCRAQAGHAIGIAELFDCRRMKPGDGRFALCDVDTDRYAFCLRNVRLIAMFPVSGRLGFFDVQPNGGTITLIDESEASNAYR